MHPPAAQIKGTKRRPAPFRLKSARRICRPARKPAKRRSSPFRLSRGEIRPGRFFRSPENLAIPHRMLGAAAALAMFGHIEPDLLLQPLRDQRPMAPAANLVAAQRGGLVARGHLGDLINDRLRVEAIKLGHVAPVKLVRRHAVEPWTGLKIAKPPIAGRIPARHRTADADPQVGRRQRREP